MKNHVKPLYVLITGVIFISIARFIEPIIVFVSGSRQWGIYAAEGIGAALGIGGVLFLISGVVGVVKERK